MKWFLRRAIAGELRRAGPASLYRMVRESAVAEFAEDNAPTLNAFLSEQFEATQDALPASAVIPTIEEMRVLLAHD